MMKNIRMVSKYKTLDHRVKYCVEIMYRKLDRSLNCRIDFYIKKILD